ncbi:MAG: cell surface protein [Psychroflexus sp.]|nr:cell surface protein [Psychroflexus sp.]
MKPFLRFYLLFTLLTFTACSNDDDVNMPAPQGEFDSGTLVLNEGGIGSVTFISNDYSRVDQQIYTSVNSGEDLGQFVQSMFFDNNDRAYMISNGSNLITIVNRFTFEKVGEITANLDVPRYGTVVDGKAYVTNQASFTTNADDFVSVIDLDTLETETIIAFDVVVEHIISDGTKLYVQNSAFGFGSGISVIDPSTNTIEAELDTGEALQSISINANTLYALNATGIDAIDLVSQELLTTKSLPSEISGAKNLRISNGVLYYTFANSVYQTPLSETVLSSDPFITYDSDSEFGTMYGFEVNDGLIYLADATDFASNGFVEIYDLDGNLVFETEVGLGPNGFYFN